MLHRFLTLLAGGFRRSAFLAPALAILCAATAVAAEPTPSPLPTTFFKNLHAGRHQTVVVYGTSLTAAAEWPKALAAYFDTAFPGQVATINAAQSGQHSNWGVANLAERVLAQKPDLVFLEFSVNDSATKHHISLEQSAANLDRIVRALRAQNPQVEIVLQTMNPAWDSPTEPSGKKYGSDRPTIETYYEVYRRYAHDHDRPLVDNLPAWQKLRRDNLPEFQRLVADGIHPIPEGSLAITWPAIRALLEETRAATAPRTFGPPPASFFVPGTTPATALYRDGWIDLNKNGARDPYENPSLPVDARIDDLLARMTLEEKTAQMTTLYGFPRVLKDELPTAAWKTAFWKDGIGNIDEHMNGNEGWKRNFADPAHDLPWSLHVQAINEVQRWFVEQTRLGIPVDFTNEGIRGLLHSKATSFPAQLAVGATFDVPLVAEIGRITGREARALGYTNVYSPVLDLARDPRWGRTTETYGEDPYLVSQYGLAQVRGIQGEHVVSTLKHFAVYSIPKGGRDGEARTDPQATWREIQELHLAPFRAAVRDAGALGVMASYNDYDGVPVEGNRLFLTEILRGEYGFKGYVVSDSAAVEFIHTKHRVAATPAEAIRQSVDAGLNIRTNFTPPEAYGEPLRQLVRDGKLPMATIDARVRDILRVKYWLGLFDTPYRDPAAATALFADPAAAAASARAARESIVLLKNEANALPLDRAKLKKVLVAGPLADDARGWWSRYGPQRLDYITPLAGLRAKFGAAVEVKYEKGCDVIDEAFPESDTFKEPLSAAARARIDAAVTAAAEVDLIVAVLGETEEISQESASRISLDLPGHQEELLRALHATGKPLVLVLSNGRPLSVNWAQKHVPAIVELWFPGEQGGAALADVLCGDFNPSGRLPITFPKSVGQVPFNFPARPGSQERDFGQVFGPLYPFGHGLSYTTFKYANLRLKPERQNLPATTVTVTADITNTGTRAGDEVVQLYLRDDYSTVTTYDKALRGFTRVSLAPGETKTVTFTLGRAELELYDRARQWTVEPGRFTAMLGTSSEDIRLYGTFTIAAPDGSAPEEAPIDNSRFDPR